MVLKDTEIDEDHDFILVNYGLGKHQAPLSTHLHFAGLLNPFLCSSNILKYLLLKYGNILNINNRVFNI